MYLVQLHLATWSNYKYKGLIKSGRQFLPNRKQLHSLVNQGQGPSKERLKVFSSMQTSMKEEPTSSMYHFNTQWSFHLYTKDKLRRSSTQSDITGCEAKSWNHLTTNFYCKNVCNQDLESLGFFHSTLTVSSESTPRSVNFDSTHTSFTSMANCLAISAETTWKVSVSTCSI